MYWLGSATVTLELRAQQDRMTTVIRAETRLDDDMDTLGCSKLLFSWVPPGWRRYRGIVACPGRTGQRQFRRVIGLSVRPCQERGCYGKMTNVN